MGNRCPRIGVALGGGGARGLAHIGVLRRLTESGMPIHCISGTSIGAIVGGIFASGNLERVIEWCCEPDWKKLPRLFFEPHFTGKALIRGERIEHLLSELIPAKDFESLSIPYAAIATDLFTGEKVTMRSGNLHSAIRASMSIPGVFRPVERDGKILVDGGLSDPLPTAACRQMGAELIVAVDINPPGVAEESGAFSRMNLLDVLTCTFRVFNCEMTRRVLGEVAPDVLVRPEVGGVSLLDFRNASRMVDAGEAAMRLAEKELERLLSAR